MNKFVLERGQWWLVNGCFFYGYKDQLRLMKNIISFMYCTLIKTSTEVPVSGEGIIVIQEVRESRSQRVRESGSQGVRESGSQGVRESGSQRVSKVTLEIP